jgi:3-dehydroquinate synthase
MHWTKKNVQHQESIMSIMNLELKKVVDDSYDIEIGRHLQDTLVEDIKKGLVGSVRRFAVITDSIVNGLYAEAICEKLREQGYLVSSFVIPEGEKSKTREVKACIEDAMLEAGFRRDCCVINVGGGVVSDLGGFLAGTFGRGVPFLNYSTTLLSAADASVGGKTAVDTPLATNLIGLFNQPKKVYIDLATWESLDQRQLSSGMAETIKHACLGDYDMFTYLEKHMEEILSGDEESCGYIAEKNCQIKYQIVMKDERESGLREVLNLGHTVGRAIETVSDYRLLHGEALAIGMAAQVRLAVHFHTMTEEEAARVIALYEKANLPTGIPSYIDREELVKKLYTDKKVRNGHLRFVLQKGIGAIDEPNPGEYARLVSEEDAREIILQMPGI